MTKDADEVGDGLGYVVRGADPADQRLRRAPLLLTRLDRDGAGRNAAHAHVRRERAGEDAGSIA